MAAALSGIFHWRETWVSRAYTCEALKSELIKFETQTTERYRPDGDGGVALESFVVTMEELAMAEVAEWRALQIQKEAIGAPRKGK